MLKGEFESLVKCVGMLKKSFELADGAQPKEEDIISVSEPVWY
jgi:hypothetical protein